MNYLKRELYSLVKTEERIFDFIQDSALDGMWYWDLENPENKWMNPKFWVTLGYDPEAMPHTTSCLKKIIHPDDLEKIESLCRNHSNSTECTFDEILRYTHKNGGLVWVHCKGMAILNHEGKPIRILGAHINVTGQKAYELELKRQIDKYDNVIEGLNVGTWEWDIVNDKLSFNERWSRILGYETPELIITESEDWKKIILPEDREKSQHKLREYLKGETPIFDCVCRMFHKDGRILWVSHKGRITSRLADGTPTWMTGSTQDITERKEAENALLESYHRNRLFVEQAPSAIAMFDMGMNYLAASQKWLEDYNLEGQDIIGKSHYEVFPEISEEWKSFHQKCLNGESFKRTEDKFERADGTVQWLTWDIRPWHIEGDKIGGIIMYTADITTIKEREHLLTKYQNLLEKTNEAARIGTWEVDVINQKIFWSKVTRSIHEADDDFVPDFQSTSVFYQREESINKVKEGFLKCINHHEPYDIEFQITTLKNNEKWIRCIGIPNIEDGKTTKVYGLFEDVSERNKAIRELAFQEEQFRQTFEFAANGMALVGLSGQWLEVNKSLCEMLGYTKPEFLATTFQDITYPDDLEADLTLLQELIAGERESYQMEKRYFHKNGHLVWGLLSVSMVKKDNGEPSHFVSQINNITLRKQTKVQLKDTINRLQGIQDASTQVSIIETDLDGNILSFNKGAENLLGYQAEEVVNKATPEIIHLDQELETRSQELTIELNQPIGKLDSLLAYAKQGRFETREWTYVRKDGSTFPVLLNVTSIRNQENEIVGFLGIGADVSSLKKAEREIKSLLDVTKEQNERLLNFAHIVSHNLRSHSGNLSMLTDLMSMETPEIKENEFFPLLIEASENLRETIGHLNEVVAMNSKTKENLLKLNLKDYIEKTVSGIHATIIETHTTIENDVDGDITVDAIPAYLESILLNLFTNAIKYKSPERAPYITINAFQEKNFVRIEVTDNGLGIDMKLHGAKIFGMYKTFHGNEDARGVGLFITRNQIESMGGKVEVESEVNKGTTFKIHLTNEED